MNNFSLCVYAFFISYADFNPLLWTFEKYSVLGQYENIQFKVLTAFLCYSYKFILTYKICKCRKCFLHF